MARKKRGGKTGTSKKVKTLKVVQNIINEDAFVQSPTQTESEESCGSGTPKTCTTPVDTEKMLNVTSVQHKKFGKFRCLVEDSNKIEMSSSESEMQIDSLEVDPNTVEIITIDPDNLIEDIKSIEITESETLQDIPVCAEEIVQEEVVEITENVVEITENIVEIAENMEEVKTDFGSVQLSDDSQEQCIILQENILYDNDLAKPSEEVEVKPQETDNDKKKSDDTDTGSDSATTVRRSSRIKSINVLKQRSKGHGLVKSDKLDRKDKVYKPTKSISTDLDIISENSNSNTALSEKNSTPTDSPSFATPIIGIDSEQKPVKVKSRWRRSSELEMGGSSPLSSCPQSSPQVLDSEAQNAFSQIQKSDSPVYDEEMENRLRQFHTLLENQYLTERTSCKEAKKMLCDCFLTKEEIERGEFGCGEDCLNRLLMIECGSQCVVGDRCTNKRFQKMQYASCEVFRTDKKGFGIRATADIPYGEFILEYVGEVLDPDEFDKRAKDYSKYKNRHYYFMALRADAVIDATLRGNISRFINHSCDPNAETQKWTVNGELRIGFFSKRTILANEEITFDYQFQRYGKDAQKCYCESANCRGWIGEEPVDDDDEEDEEESEREEENEEERKDSTEDIKEPKTVVKKVVKKRRQLKKQRMDIFEDLDLDEEIGMLSATGVKNQAHTLKLSRLMVRAKDVCPRMQLLKLLRQGDLPCRRLFLDYHGLRLIHGWMCDAANMTDLENKNYSFKIEILETLASLPIPNKTMLQDSKVLSTVEKWSSGSKIDITSPTDSVSNSPQIDIAPEPVKQEPMKAEPEPMEVKNSYEEDFTEDIKIDLSKPEVILPEVKESNNAEINQENKEVSNEVEQKMEEVEIKEEKDNEKLVYELTSKLLSDWSVLKEVFRIPKKERIEQMKEHEREADRGYKAGLDLEQDIKRDARYYWKSDRYRILVKERDRRKVKEPTDHERNLIKKVSRMDERNIVPIRKLSKHERRQLFALQVAQEEEGRRRKQEQEMWRLHEQRCLVIGADPRLSNMEMNSMCYWNPNPGHWQQYPPPNAPAQQPPIFDLNCRPQPLQMIPPLPGNLPISQPRPPIIPQFPPQAKEEVLFAGPLPPPVSLPPKWKCAKDKYGRPYYYHVKMRISQWEPPEFPPPEDTTTEFVDETSSSSDTSSLSSDSTTDSDEDSEIGDTKLLLEIRNKLKKIETKPPPKLESPVDIEPKMDSPSIEIEEELQKPIDVPKRKREGLVQEIIISPRREEDKLASKLEMKKYKETKEKLRRQKQLILEQTKKKLKSKLGKSSSSKSVKKHRSSKSAKLKLNSKIDMNCEEARKIKETFRSSMASEMVQNLNAYRKPDCKIGRITNTEDFKHLARKLTHFVMLKELKHCQNIGELICNDSVKTKARDFVKKYMTKFGEVYSRPKDDTD